MTQAKDVLTLHQLGLFAQLPTCCPWGDVMFSTLHVTEAGLRTVRNTLALRRMISDAPALSADEKLRFLRSWLTCLATSLAKVFAPLAGGDAPLRLMLDRLAQPQFWVAALTIATRQHAQLLLAGDALEELEVGDDSLTTGEQVVQWYGRAGPGDGLSIA